MILKILHTGFEHLHTLCICWLLVKPHRGQTAPSPSPSQPATVVNKSLASCNRLVGPGGSCYILNCVYVIPPIYSLVSFKGSPISSVPPPPPTQ